MTSGGRIGAGLRASSRAGRVSNEAAPFHASMIAALGVRRGVPEGRRPVCDATRLYRVTTVISLAPDPARMSGNFVPSTVSEPRRRGSNEQAATARPLPLRRAAHRSEARHVHFFGLDPHGY